MTYAADQTRPPRPVRWPLWPAGDLRWRAMLLSPTAQLLAAGVLLPNLISLVTLPFDITIPPRTGATFLFMAVALCARTLSFPFVVALYLGTLVYDLISTIALQFNLAPTEFMVAIKHAATVNVFASPVYLGLAVFLALPTTAAIWLLADRERLRHANIWVVFGCASVVAAVDFGGHVSPHYYFGAWLNSDKPVDSAVQASGFANVIGAGKRNTVIVVVEGMGYLKDKRQRDWIAAPLTAPAIATKYHITSGSAEYFGSTTSGEMRELCASRKSYDMLTPQFGAGCLPAKFKQAGYTTMSFHAYSRDMFDRKDWYPLIGFDHMIFGEQILPQTRRTCGTVFRGGCDIDMEGPIKQAVRAAGRGPFLLYWLTLNTHVPVVPADVHAPFHCDSAKSYAVCVMSTMWRQVFAAVSRLARDPHIAPADILIVGDHAPPLWSARGRGMFEPGLVAWVRLTPR